MNPSDVANRLGRKSGHRLLSYGYVGLPVFRINAECIVLEQTKLSAIEEYLLRAIEEGINNADRLAAFLGLPKSVIDIALADGIRDSSIEMTLESRVVIAAAGKKKLADQGVIRPKQLMLSFTYDALLRRPQYYPESALYQPKQMRLLSIPEIRAVPDRGPDSDEVDLELVNQTIRAALRARKGNPARVLRIERIHRSYRLFLQAVALQFKSVVGDDFHVEFAIDGRPSQDHDQQFAQSNGSKRSKIFSQLTPRNPASDLNKEIDVELASELKELCDKSMRDQEKTTSELQLDAKTRRGTDVKNSGHKPLLTLGRLADRGGAAAVEIQSAVQVLSVLQHHPLLIKSIQEASKRLLIISPWIRNDVVNEAFIETLTECLARGVETYIGFGIGAKEEWKEIDSDCKHALSRLSGQYANFNFKRLGDTHAKVLLKDDDYFVLTSFNWLSFRGDPRRPFREELGNMIAIPNKVEEFFRSYSSRFD